MHPGDQSHTQEVIDAFVENALRDDDVFHTAFLSALILCVGEGEELEGTSPRPYPVHNTWQCKWVKTIHRNINFSGPCAIYRTGVYMVYRLEQDYANCFVSAFQPTPLWDQGSPTLLNIGHGGHSARVLALPTRIQYPVQQRKILQSLRFTVKDMFDIKNQKVGLGSRDFLKLSERSCTTAPSIQSLLDSGAHLLGASQLCAMVGKTEPTQTIDYIAPFNPRGDGWQSPSGGSSGQASAVSAYSWLDFAIGSDATISGRRPAQVNGCFSFRPSTGEVSTCGMWSAVPYFDTPCIFSRSLAIIRRVHSVWQPTPLPTLLSSSARIIVPIDFLPIGNQPQMGVFKKFVEDFQHALAAASLEYTSIDGLWSRNPPEEAHGSKLCDYLGGNVPNNSYVNTFWKKVHSFIEMFRLRYGHDPFFPLPEGIHLWDSAKEVSEELQNEAWHKIVVYREWLLRSVMEKSNTFLVVPSCNVEPCYRDTWPATPIHQGLTDSLLLSPIMGAPEVVVPVAQIAYYSRITNREEVLPLCFSIIGFPGMDSKLLDVLELFLAKSQRPMTVDVGSRMFQ